MPGKAVKLGPFKNGLNNVGEASTIDDSQLAIVNNFDIDNDGSLVSRPAFVAEADSPNRITVQLYRNQALNPKSAIDTTGYTAYGSSGTTNVALSKITAPAPAAGAGSIYAARSAVTGTLVGGAAAYVDIRYSLTGIVAGQAQTFAAFVRTNTTSLAGRAFLQYLDDSQTVLATFAVNFTLASAFDTSASGYSFQVTGVAPAGTASATLIARGTGGGIVIGTVIDMTAVMFGLGTSAPDFFDGDTTNTSLDIYEWSGTPNGSYSNHSDFDSMRAKMTMLGYYSRADGEIYLVATSRDNASRTPGTYVYQLSTQIWTKIWDVVASGFAQYDNKIVMCQELGNGGYWDGMTGVFTGTASMPAMTQIVVYGERFWGFGPKQGASTTVYFSNLTVISPAQSIYDWQPTSNFFTVGKGDGQWITAIVADPNALLIFRNSSTYQFTYPTSPITGTLRKLNSSVGADNWRCVAAYENYYLILNSGFLYQFINYLYYSRNVDTVRFTQSLTSTVNDVNVSIFGQRAIVFYFGALYVYNIPKGTWTTWSNQYNAQRFLQIPPSSVTGSARQVLIEESNTSNAKVNRVIRRAIDGVIPFQPGLENFTCYLKTKTYNFDDFALFKRMMYWTVTFKASTGVLAMVTPADIVAGSTTWNVLNTMTWNTLNQGTWNNPTTGTPTTTDNIPFPLPAPQQAIAKVQARMRFKSTFFEVQIKADGSVRTSPARIFSMSAYMKEHMHTRDKVS